MVYTSASHPRMYDAPWKLPASYRDRVPYQRQDGHPGRLCRYAVPWITIHPETGGLQVNGFAQSTDALGPLSGTPRTLLSNPYPVASYTYQNVLIGQNPVQ